MTENEGTVSPDDWRLPVLRDAFGIALAISGGDAGRFHELRKHYSFGRAEWELLWLVGQIFLTSVDRDERDELRGFIGERAIRRSGLGKL